ncbi:MAG: ferritin [Cytophagales bacterium]|nr:ferritin [Cytophagales bacterium]
MAPKHQITKHSSLIKETENLLNQQIEKEASSSFLYLSMASWCEREGYDHSADFLYAQTQEEQGHMMRIFRYVNEVGGEATVPEIGAIKSSYGSLKEIFEEALKSEIEVTKSIGKIATHCLNIGDHATLNFLNWFVKEQREEEKWARKAVSLFSLLGDEGPFHLFSIDKEIGKLRNKSPN